MDFNYIDLKQIDAVADILRSKGIVDPEVGLILGSGLNGYVENLKSSTEIIRVKYSELPGFVMPTTSGHKGELVFATVNGKRLLIMAGRFHYYEGHPIQRVVFPIRIMIRLGIKRLIITNAAGAINQFFEVGNLMVFTDHINLLGVNPLIGHNMPEFGPRFPDMTEVYDDELREKIINQAANEGIRLEQGVYVATTGPSFETPAEIKYHRAIGGDAVGMSSVPEAIVANHAGLEVVGISCLSNMAAGVLNKPLSAEEVDEVGKSIAGVFGRVIEIAIGVEKE